MISVGYGAATSAGRVRDHNEDNFLARPPVFVVADGMGGHAAGEVASAIVVTAFGRLADKPTLQTSDVAAAIEECNSQIVWKSQQDESRAGMGTTVAGIVAVEAAGVDHWVVFNIGDSRVYQWNQGVLRQLSTDHSEVQELVDAGQITHDDARRHPRRNVVTRSLGTIPGPVVDQWLLPPSVGERFVVCSDGLSGELTDSDIAALLRAGGSPQGLADGLVAQAVAAGGRDNVTAIVLEVTATLEDGADEDTLPRGAGS